MCEWQENNYLLEVIYFWRIWKKVQNLRFTDQSKSVDADYQEDDKAFKFNGQGEGGNIRPVERSGL